MQCVAFFFILCAANVGQNIRLSVQVQSLVLSFYSKAKSTGKGNYWSYNKLKFGDWVVIY